MQIRPIAEAELHAVLELYHQCEDFLSLGPQPHASMQMVRADLDLSRRNGGIFCGIYGEESQELMGVLDYIPGNFEGHPEHAFIELLMIAPQFRQRSLGKQAVAWVEGEIKKNPQITAIRSGVQVNNPGAISFWTGNGYKIVSGPNPMPDQTIAFDLRKNL